MQLISSVAGLRAEVVETPGQAADHVEREDVALVIVHMDEIGNLDELGRLLSLISLNRRATAVLVVSERYHASQALALLRMGVADYLARPMDLGRMAYLIDALTLRARHVGPQQAGAKSVVEYPRLLSDGEEAFLYLPTTPMGRVMSQIERVAPQETTVLLGGETGTGKSRLAGVIHRLSPRRDKPFLTINCSALSTSLIESEMFGHVKGAFTGADTDRVGKFAEVGSGTLFLDEVDSLPLVVQAKLLRAVEERVFEPVGSNKTLKLTARLIAACNRPLDQEVAAGRFRSDLYYRLNVVTFAVPPLRNRKGAVRHLAHTFVTDFATRSGQDVHDISFEALQALERYDWPGNIRELRNVIERAVALCPDSVIRLDDLPDHFHDLAPISEGLSPNPRGTSLADSKDDVERYRIGEALERNNNNKLRAAAELGISRMTLYNKLRKYGFGA